MSTAKTTPLVAPARARAAAAYLRATWHRAGDALAATLHAHRDGLIYLSLLSVIAGAAWFARAWPGLSLAWERTTAPDPIVLIATPTPSLPRLPAPAAPAPAGPTLPRATVAYAAPGGAVLGGLEPGRAYAVLARYGAAWLQIDAGSGPVWVAASDAGLTVDAALADLAPPPAPQVVVVERPAPAPQVVSVQQPAPAAPGCDLDGDGVCGGGSSGPWDAAPAPVYQQMALPAAAPAAPPNCDLDGDGVCGGGSSGEW